MQVDRSFGDKGFVPVVWGSTTRSTAYSVAVDHNNIYMAGPVYFVEDGSLNIDYGLVCLHLDGDMCEEFGENGFTHVDFDNVDGSRTDVATGVTIDPNDGYVFVLGTSNQGPSASDANLTFAISRHNPSSGMLDKMYGTLFNKEISEYTGTGKSITKFGKGRNDEPFCQFWMNDQLTAYGFSNPTTTTGAGPSFNLGGVKYLNDGRPDNSYGGEFGSPYGTVDTSSGVGWDDRPRGCTYDGMFEYVVGRVTKPNETVEYGTVFRLRNGRLDKSWGNNAVWLDDSVDSATGRGVVLLGGVRSMRLYDVVSSGRDIVVSGYIKSGDEDSNTSSFYVAKLDKRGDLLWETSVDFGYDSVDVASSLIVHKSNIYLYGESDKQFAVACIRHNGNICHNGKRVYSFGADEGYVGGFFRQVAVQGKSVYAVGETFKDNSPSTFAVVKFRV